MTRPGGWPLRAAVSRFAAYNVVGIVGVLVQQGLLVALVDGLGLHYLAATACAVQATAAHNFIWHVRWTWRDRLGAGRQSWWPRLVRFTAVNGAVAVMVQVGLTGFYVAAFGVHYTVANVLAIATGSMVSFLINDRVIFCGRKAPVVAGAVMLAAVAPSALAGQLQPETLQGWEAYVEATEQRIANELASPDAFLGTDFEADGPRIRATLAQGGIPIASLTSHYRDGSAIEIPRGAVHHWRGAIFIRGVSLDAVLDRVQTPLRREDLQDDVLESRLLERRPDGVRVFLKLRREKFVTVHYNTEHWIRYVRHGTDRAWSRSVATKIAELDEAGTLRERERAVGDDRGFLWRLHSYWRYEETPNGVIVECESLSLSRAVPAVLRWMVAPMIRDAARESMERTLRALQQRLVSTDRAPAAVTADIAAPRRGAAVQ